MDYNLEKIGQFFQVLPVYFGEKLMYSLFFHFNVSGKGSMLDV